MMRNKYSTDEERKEAKRARDRIYDKMRRVRDKEKVAARKKRYEQTHVEAHKARRRRYNESEKGKLKNKEYRIKYYSLNKNKRRYLYGKKVTVQLISNYDSMLCGICGLLIESKYEIDHIIPIARNGTEDIDNLQLTHPTCNRTKHKRLQNEFVVDIMILRAFNAPV